MEDIWKLDNEEIFNKIINLLIEANLQISTDPVIDMVSDVLSHQFENVDFKNLLTSIITTIYM